MAHEVVTVTLAESAAAEEAASAAIAADKFTPEPALIGRTIEAAAWVEGTEYALNARVSYEGITYVSLKAANKEKKPTENPTWWEPQPLSPGQAPEYSATVSYGKGAIVVEGGVLYESLKAANEGNAPKSKPVDWVPIAASTLPAFPLVNPGFLKPPSATGGGGQLPYPPGNVGEGGAGIA